jgi:hypothetical protein
MWMTAYISAVKRGLRDRYGFTPDAGSSEDDPTFNGNPVPDGVYPMVIDGKLDRVRISGDRISCCNFDGDKSAA